MADAFVRDNTPQYLAIAENEIERAVARTTIKVQREARRLVMQFSSPPPSQPGEPPHLDTGTLARSIDQETLRLRTGEFIGRVGTNLKYGGYLERGTSIMAPRPYLRPALAMHQATLNREVAVAMRKAGR